MTGTPRVVLLMHPFAGYDRGLLEGIARYAQTARALGVLPRRRTSRRADARVGQHQRQDVSRGGRPAGVPARESFSLRRLDAAGVIGRIQTPAIARTLLSSGLPLIAIDLNEKQLADSHPLSNISEVCADSHTRAASPRSISSSAASRTSLSADTKDGSGRTGGWRVFRASSRRRALLPRLRAAPSPSPLAVGPRTSIGDRLAAVACRNRSA